MILSRSTVGILWMTQKYQSFPACEPVHRVMHWTGSAIRTFSQIIPDVLRKRFTRKYPRFESEFKTRAWYCLGHDKPSSVSFVAVYGKKPEYPVACCRDEWQAGDGGGNPQVFPWKMPRSLLRGSSLNQYDRHAKRLPAGSAPLSCYMALRSNTNSSLIYNRQSPIDLLSP